MSFAPKKKSLVGVDITKKEVRLAQVSKIKHVYQVQNVASKALVKEIEVKYQIDQWEIVTDALSELVAALNLQGATTVVCLPAHLVMRKRLQLSASIKDVHIGAKILEQIKMEMPSMQDFLCLDYVKLRPKQKDKIELLAIYTREDYLLDYIKSVNAAGLETKIVDVNTYALQRLFCGGRMRLVIPKNHVEAIVCAYDERLELIIYNEAEIIFCKQWSDAGLFKKEISPQLLAFFKEWPLFKIDQLFLFGIEHDFSALSAYINKVNQLNPLEWLQFNSEESNQEKYLLALGAAMRETPKW